MQRNFLEKFLNKISNFPTWIKEIIYINLSKEVNPSNDLAYIFATYKPKLTDKGKCELDYKKSNFDQNIYNILEYCDQGISISEMALNTYMSMEEIANYFLFGLDEGFIQLPDNSQIINIAGFLAGKFRTGEYFVQDGIISEAQLDDAVLNYEHRAKKHNKKFGQSLIELGLISQKQLDIILSIKEEAKKRFILDHNEVPKITLIDEYEKKIKELTKENELLKMRLMEMGKIHE
ncbi:hypothetical protein J6G99_00155 [bacterium]|nr:hypothetical protein [bacterium]